LLCKKGSFTSAFNFPFRDLIKPIVHTNCLGNEELGLRNRYLKKTPKLQLNKSVLTTAVNDLIKAMEPHFDGEITYDEFMDGKKGALGQRYLKAVDKLLEEGFNVNLDSRVTPFVKNEKYFEDKPPRLVYSRDPKFTTLFSLYTIPLERALVCLPQVAKGCNYLERGAKFSRLLGAWLLENDYSKFESTQRVPLYDLTFVPILKHFFPDDQRILKLFELSHTKQGHTLNGLMFKYFGMMASGDAHTGLLNTILNWVACRYFEIVNGYGEGEFIVDGDDGVIKVPLGANPRDTFIDFGFDAKLILRQDYHDVEFCSGKFMQIRPGVFYQVQNFHKLLNSVPNMINNKFSNSLDTYYGSLGFMYNTVYDGIPLYSHLGKFLMSCNKNNNLKVNTLVIDKTSYGLGNEFKQHPRSKLEIDTNCCMVELCMLFDLSFAEMSEITEFLSSNILEFPPTHTMPFKERVRGTKKHGDYNFQDIKSVDFIGKVPKRPKGYRSD
jgi:hypothetical protein